MELNRIVFPAPTPSYTAFTLNRLMWIPRTRFFSLKTIVPTLEKFDEVKIETKNIFDSQTNIKSHQSNIFTSFNPRQHSYSNPLPSLL